MLPQRGVHYYYPEEKTQGGEEADCTDLSEFETVGAMARQVRKLELSIQQH